MELLPVLTSAVSLSAAMTILAHYARPPRLQLVRIFKPLTTILILVVALLPGTIQTDPYAQLICAGLVLSLIGDILLVLPQDRFLAGLASFLLAQICYAIAFRDGAAARGFGWLLLVLAGVGVVTLAMLWNGLAGMMKGAVSAYIVAILAMSALAVGRAMLQPSVASQCAAAGALLFVLSDALLAINRFRKPFRLVHLAVLGTYFGAQLLIALSV